MSDFWDVSFLPENPVVIDCGANEGQFLDAVLPQLRGHPTVVAIEPQACEAGVCAARHPGVLVLPFALGRVPCDSVMLFRHPCSQSSSFLEMTEDHHRVWGNPTWTPVAKERVLMLTLDMVCGILCLDHIDLLKMDVQGFEGEVLAGAGPMLDKTANIISEVSSIELYRGQIMEAEMTSWLTKKGFRFQKIFNERMYQGAVASCDAWWSR